MRLFLFVILTLALSSCAPYAFREMPNSVHTYKLTIKDVNGTPLEGATVHFIVDEGSTHRAITDTIVVSPSSGRILYSVRVIPDSKFTYEPLYSSKYSYEVSKDGYYKRTGSLSMFLENKETFKFDDVTMITPTDYINPSFLSSSKGVAIKSKLLGFLNDLIIQSLLADSYLETQSINLGTFKDSSYLAFKFRNTNTYNSLKLSKYDIAKTLFDEVVRKVLNPLNDNLGESKGFYGYDLTIIGYTKNFINEYASSTAITYRFLIPNTIVNKYKQKDISGQQVLDSSVILMDDERIELKLQ